MAKGLTDIAIRNLKPGGVRREIPDPGCAGLYLIIQPSGRKSFAVRYRFAGLPRKLTLQSGVSLAAARKLTADAMHEVAQGRDPSEAKRATCAPAGAQFACFAAQVIFASAGEHWNGLCTPKSATCRSPISNAATSSKCSIESRTTTGP